MDELSRNIEAMSMTSVFTDIATPPPPPPPLEYERWRTMSKTYNPKRSGFFARQFSPEKDFFKASEKSDFSSRYSRESSVASDKSDNSVMSRSSTLSRLFSKRSASIDSIFTSTWRSKKQNHSTPATPQMSNYATWRRRGRSSPPNTPSITEKLRTAFSTESKQKIGKFCY